MAKFVKSTEVTGVQFNKSSLKDDQSIFYGLQIRGESPEFVSLPIGGVVLIVEDTDWVMTENGVSSVVSDKQVKASYKEMVEKNQPKK